LFRYLLATSPSREVVEDADSMKDEAAKGFASGMHCCVMSAMVRRFDNVKRYITVVPVRHFATVDSDVSFASA
jgi:hypothetical protein